MVVVVERRKFGSEQSSMGADDHDIPVVRQHDLQHLGIARELAHVRLQLVVFLGDQRIEAEVVQQAEAQLLGGVHIMLADLSNTDKLASAIADCKAVIYCAGSVRGRNLEDFRTANVAGVRSVVEAMNQASPQTPLLLISSLAASRPRVSDYANSKFLGEREVIHHAKFPWTIFRPPAVYGQGDREMLRTYSHTLLLDGRKVDVKIDVDEDVLVIRVRQPGREEVLLDMLSAVRQALRG